MSGPEHLSLVEVLLNTLRAVEAQSDPMTPERAKLARYLRERIAANGASISPDNAPIPSPPCDSRDFRVRRAVPAEKPPSARTAPALYELRHLRRALSRLEATHATSSPVIKDLKSSVVTRICELETQLGSTKLIDGLSTIRNT